MPNLPQAPSMQWAPRKWLAALLGFFFQWLGLLYVGRWRLALAYLLLWFVVTLIEMHFGLPGYFFVALSLLCSVHAYRIAVKAPPVAVRPWYGRWCGIIGVGAGPFLMVLLLRAFLIEPFRTPSAAMAPTYQIGTIFLVKKGGYGHFGTFGVFLTHRPPSAPVRRGTVLVFESPVNSGQNFVKRVVGIPGDAVSYKGKVLYVNGVTTRKQETSAGDRLIVREELDGQSYETLINPQRPAEDFEVTVPSNHYFLLGDNRDGSNDSRRFGPVKGELLIGEAVYVFHKGTKQAVYGLLPQGPSEVNR